MDPQHYVAAYLERLYLDAHHDLTPAARGLVHEDIAARPEKYASSEHAQALVAYAQCHTRLITALDRLDDLPDGEFERKRGELFEEARIEFFKIAENDRLCIDARLVGNLLSNIPLDACISELMDLEQRSHEYLAGSVEGFSDEAPQFWTDRAVAAWLERPGSTSAFDNAPTADERARCARERMTVAEPALIGWLHTLEAISQLCLASARYHAASDYARRVRRAAGYPNRAEGTVFLALARLEDEDGFFTFAHELEAEAGADAPRLLDDSPWFLLARTLLLYKLGRRKPARRALRDFVARCDGGAFFLLNPTYMTPYLPVRPEPRHAWGRTHQAVWEADGIIADTPDFAAWAESIEGVYDESERFADRNGF